MTIFTFCAPFKAVYAKALQPSSSVSLAPTTIIQTEPCSSEPTQTSPPKTSASKRGRDDDVSLRSSNKRRNPYANQNAKLRELGTPQLAKGAALDTKGKGYSYEECVFLD
jgi:hypothetical protein